jgi:superfamily II DNA helicase RecQ
MLIRILCLAFNSAAGKFDDTELKEFMKDAEILSMGDYFFTRNEIPYLALIFKYFPTRQELDPKLAPQGKREEEWRQTLTEADMGLFNLLRNWRSERCKKDGLPPYVIFNNQQLAQIVKARPQSMADLQKIEGVGKAKADKYGEEVLAISKINVGPSETSST